MSDLGINNLKNVQDQLSTNTPLSNSQYLIMVHTQTPDDQIMECFPIDRGVDITTVGRNIQDWGGTETDTPDVVDCIYGRGFCTLSKGLLLIQLDLLGAYDYI